MSQDGGALDFVVPASLYIHVPLCASKCAYCDFYSLPAGSASESFELELVRAILRRASALAERFCAESFETVYVGGGTPSVLSPLALRALLKGIGRLARGSRARGPKEWTVEANPDSLGPETLQVMAREGVTRISLGVQSLAQDELAILGRRHGPEAALEAVRNSAKAGFRVSADLIAGIPATKESGRGFADSGRLARFAGELLDAGASHLSIYDLTLEEGTPLAAAKPLLRFPGEDEDWDSRQKLEASLALAGLRRYEVSNYAARGAECLHNLAYWHMDSYIGAGPGAVSTLARATGSSLRIEEARIIEDYWSEASPRASETEIGVRDARFETMMMAFRTSFGLDLAGFRRRHGLEPQSLIGGSLASWDARLVAGEPWPGQNSSAGPALDGKGLDLLNRFLGDCLQELEG